MKRGIVIADPHCGHRVGLTPPAFNGKRDKKWAAIRQALWREFRNLLRQLEPIDFVLYLGDGIDGTGVRSGGTEQLMLDRIEQVDCCAEVLNTVRLHARRGFKMFGVRGTPYHTGNSEDWEDLIAQKAGMEHMGNHEWIDIEGHIFDIKHKCGASTIPHGRFTAIARERLWNTQWWQSQGGQPKADVILRAHVHYHDYCGDPDYVAMTCPALQGWGSKYGARQCSGIVHWGLISFDVDKRGVEWRSHVVDVKAQKPKVRTL